MSSPAAATMVVPAARLIIDLGMDVHNDSITIVVPPADRQAPSRVERLPNERPKPRKCLDRLARNGELQTCYEASGAGYVLHLTAARW